MAVNRQFIPCNTFLQRLLLRLGFFGRSCLTVCLLGLGAILWFYSIYKPLSTAFNRQGKNICEAQLLIERIAQTHQQSLDAQTMAQQLSTESAHIGTDAQSQLLLLLTTISDAGIKLLSYTTDRMIKKNTHTVQQVRLVLSGSLAQIVRVFVEIQQKKMQITCSHVICTKTDANHCVVTIDMGIMS